MTADDGQRALDPDPMRTVTDVADIERLMDVAGHERAALRELDTCLTRVRQVWQAQSHLARLDAQTLRSVLQARRHQIDGDPR